MYNTTGIGSGSEQVRNRGYFEASASVLQVKKREIGEWRVAWRSPRKKKESWQGIRW